MFDAGLGERCGNCCSRALYCKSRRRLEWSYTRIKKVTKCPVLEVAAASSGVLRLVVAKLGISWLRWIKGTGEDLVRVGLRITSLLVLSHWSLRGKVWKFGLVMFDAGLGERCGNCCSRALYCKSRRRLEWSYTRIKKVTKCPVLEVAAASSGVLRLVVAKLGISWLRWIKGTGEDLVELVFE
ncbi:hypothetical protein Droror1_Dr00026979 [Drosera rotundifolia]